MSMDRLRDQLSGLADVGTALDCLLLESLELSQTDRGNVQLVDWSTGHLAIHAQRGFQEEFLKFFGRVSFYGGSACSRALRNRRQTIVTDVMADQEFSSCWEVMDRADVAAVQGDRATSDQDNREVG
jgi:hypothetical protein